MVKLTQILGHGMNPQAPIWVNPAHVMTVQLRSPRDGYGNAQTGSVVQLVSALLIQVAEPVDEVIGRLGRAP